MSAHRRTTHREPLPHSRTLQLHDTHRMIPARYSEAGTVLSRLADEETALNELAELDGATNTRLLGEEGLLPGIGVYELVYGIGYAHIVNAAFTHAAPGGGRFNDDRRGAWYAGLERETAATEVAFHKLQQLEEVDWPAEELTTYDDYLSDFAAETHDLTARKSQYRKYLQPQPIPECYREPQKLAAALLAEQSNGILYPSVRHQGGNCLVCFRPALVYNVRPGGRFQFRLQAGRSFSYAQMREVKVA